jgi:hypothetical protein
MALFASERYATIGVSNTLDIRLQLFLWALIDERKQKGAKLDYLQVFELSVERVSGEELQKVIHRQEQPAYAKSQCYRCPWPPLACKVWVIDDGGFSTMLFPDEY